MGGGLLGGTGRTSGAMGVQGIKRDKNKEEGRLKGSKRYYSLCQIVFA